MDMYILGFLVSQMVKRLPAMQETQFQALGREDPWRRKWQPTPAFLPGESHDWQLVIVREAWCAAVQGVTKSRT